MIKTTTHTETIELAHDELVDALTHFLGSRVPKKYDDVLLIGLRNDRGVFGDAKDVPMQQRLTGVNAMKISFSYERKDD